LISDAVAVDPNWSMFLLSLLW